MNPVPEKRYNYIHIHLRDAPRLVAFPFPVYAIGYIPESVLARKKNNIYKDKVEFCIRLGSPSAEYAEDHLDGKKYHTPYPHLLIKRPGVLHSYSVQDKRQAFYIIYPASLLPAFAALGADMEQPFWVLDCSKRLFSLIDQVLALLHSTGEPGVLERLDLLSFAIVEELIFSRRSAVCEEDFYRQKIYGIASHLRLHYLEEIRMDDLIAANGLSRRSFFRHWKRYFPHSPLQFLQEIRIEHGENLLATTDWSVGEIAGHLHFKTATGFIRLFRRFKGITPCQYRLQRAKTSLRESRKGDFGGKTPF